MSKSRSQLADYLVYIIIRVMVCVVQALPFSILPTLASGLAWLAYRDHYPDFAFDRNSIEQKLGAWGFEVAGYFESQGHDRNGGTAHLAPQAI